MNHHHDPPHPRGDPHQVLGVAPGATRAQINAAYRRTLRRLHPDTSRHTRPDTGPVSGPAAELSLADLQHARRELLRAAGHTAELPFGPDHRGPQRTSDRTPPDPHEAPVPDDRSPGERARDIRVRSASDQAPRTVPVRRRYRSTAGQPDILAGPIRHHQPPRPLA